MVGEQKVNTDTGTKAQTTPAIAVDGSGNLYVVWADERNTTSTANTDVYFAKRTGTHLGRQHEAQDADATTSVQRRGSGSARPASRSRCGSTSGAARRTSTRRACPPGRPPGRRTTR